MPIPPHFGLADELEAIARDLLPYRSPRWLAMRRAAKLLRAAGAERMRLALEGEDVDFRSPRFTVTVKT